MEISVGFADKTKENYIENDYIREQSVFGWVYYPAKGVELSGRIAIRYMEYPWLSTFEIEGIHAVTEDGELDDKRA